MERVIFYVDGFNFYHGLKRLKQTDRDWQKFYWLDFVKFFNHFIGDNQVLQKVYYFTAPPLLLDKSNRQSKLLEANNLINGNRFEVIKGQFYEKLVTCKICHSPYKIVEEKRTDVNIAVRMLGDCSINNVDTLVLVSADSDMIPPLQFINENYPAKKIRVYFPPTVFSIDIKNKVKQNNGKIVFLDVNFNKFENSVMPDVVNKEGKTYTIPDKWKTV
jgi:uncharacterized LabA/DUF88 family protein